MMDANTGSMKRLECGDIGHERTACPHKEHGRDRAGPSGTGGGAENTPNNAVNTVTEQVSAQNYTEEGKNKMEEKKVKM